jgi:hypothetical protein
VVRAGFGLTKASRRRRAKGIRFYVIGFGLTKVRRAGGIRF